MWLLTIYREGDMKLFIENTEADAVKSTLFVSTTTILFLLRLKVPENLIALKLIIGWMFESKNDCTYVHSITFRSTVHPMEVSDLMFAC